MGEIDRVPVTPAGLAWLETELKKFKEERPIIIRAIGEARAMGDLSENAEYHAARERQGIIEANVRKLEDLISRSEVIDPSKFVGPKIRFGATVTLYDNERDAELKYQIVGDAEADIERNKISVMAPLGRALIGKEEGDDIEFKAPGGVRTFSVVSVEYK